MPARRIALWSLLALLLAAWSPPLAEAREGARGTPPDAVDRALGRLARPLAREREAARRELVGLLPGARPRILAALAGSSFEVRAELCLVLAEDGSAEAIRGLLDALADADDAQAAAVFLRIVADEGTSARLLAALRAKPADFASGSARRGARLRELRGLLVRAELEDEFVAKKSRTGTTGYYRGQYDSLRHAREQALEIVLHIAQDKALRIPGVYRTGPYRLLRPKPVAFWELRDMAVNAIGELATPEDESVLLRLEAYTLSLARQVQRAYLRLRGYQRSPFRLDPDELEEMQEDFGIEVGQFGDLLTAQYLVKHDAESEEQVRGYLRLVERVYRPLLRFGSSTAQNIKATTLIRAGWYAEAVEVYETLLGDYYSSRSTTYYNIACAYASWSLDPALDAREQASKRRLALLHLEQAVASGWTDLGWMEQDGDLDPIREAPRYQALVERIREKLGLLPPK